MAVSNYFKRIKIQITILTTLARRNVLAYGTFNGVGVKLQVFSGSSHQVVRSHTNIYRIHITKRCKFIHHIEF